MFKLLRFRWLVLLSILVFTIGGFSSRAPSAHAAADILILSTTVTNGTSSFEAQAANALGLTVNIVDPSTWDSMTTANFASYKAIILGDPECSSIDNTSPIDPATQNNTVWGPAIKGNVILIGTDPSEHALNGTRGALTMISDGIKFATSSPGLTGAYISLSCYYADASVLTYVPLLDAFGTAAFRVQGGNSGNACPENSHITYTPPAFYGLADTDTSNWSCSIHEEFDTSSPFFKVLATNEDNIIPYIEVRPADALSVHGTQPKLRLPFSKPLQGHTENWVVIQGYNQFTHTGTYQFALDLQRADSNGIGCDSCTQNEPVQAAATGIVVFAELNTGCVALRHNSFFEGGTQRWYFTIYCHLKTPFSVTVGQNVCQGCLVGKAWNTHTPGTCSTPCPYHIHFALFSATDPNANNNRRAEQLLYLGASVIKDDHNQGGYLQLSFPWENMQVNEYGNPMWTLEETNGF